MLQLPAELCLPEATRVWAQLQPALKAEAQQLKAAAGQTLSLNVGTLLEFDSAALTVLLSASRLCQAQGVQLQLHDAPAKLRELARVYGVDGLLWPADSPQTA